GTCDCFPGGVPVDDTTCTCPSHSFFDASLNGCRDCVGGFAELQPDGSFACHTCDTGSHPTPDAESCSPDEAPPANECFTATRHDFCVLTGNCQCNHEGPLPPCRCVSEVECESTTGNNCCPNPFGPAPTDPISCLP